MPTLGSNLDFAKLEGRNLRTHQLSTAPSSPVTGQVYYNTTDNTLYWWNNTAWVSAAGGGGAPATTTSLGTIQLAGDLTGTATAPLVANGAITDVKVASANKDGVAGTYSMRTLGTGATQAMAGNTRLDTIAAPTGAVNHNNQLITNLAPPVSGTDGANKNYVDSVAQGLDVKASVLAASTANLSLTGAATVDGIVLATNDRVLVKNQTTTNQNGIYLANTAGAWTRALDADAWTELPGAFVFVETGTTQADTGWVCTADAGGTIGTTAVTFTQFSGAGAYTAGAGLTQTGTTFDVVGTANRITVAADSVDISAAYVGQTSITTLGTIVTGTWNGTTIAIANGGTGQTTAKAARETGLSASGYYSTATHGAGTTISITQATHGLRASRGLIVQCQTEATGDVLIPDINVAASGDVVVTFAASQSANTIRVTIIG
jgi:hypothetical protein